jgi:hypothetical protein
MPETFAKMKAEVTSRRCPMIRKLIAALAIVALAATPALARGGGGFQGGGGFGGFQGGGGFHGGGSRGDGFHGGRFRGGERFRHFGGSFFPYAYYPYIGYSYGNPYPIYSAPVYSPSVVMEQPPAVYQQPPVQREVLYPNGKYVLEGDGVNQAYRWIWIPATSQVSPSISPD